MGGRLCEAAHLCYLNHLEHGQRLGAARDYGLFHFADCLFLLVGRGAEIGAAVFFAVHAWNRTLSRDGA
ncbi:MAG: hypothetical protein IPJ90_05240 [Anaerolineaceae bacterium]|nr:hypothetical protein [Anaerolineaceae bacterium]